MKKEFSKTEYGEIRDLAIGALETCYKGSDLEDIDWAKCSPRDFDMGTGQVLRLQNILITIGNDYL